MHPGRLFPHSINKRHKKEAWSLIYLYLLFTHASSMLEIFFLRKILRLIVVQKFMGVPIPRGIGTSVHTFMFSVRGVPMSQGQTVIFACLQLDLRAFGVSRTFQGLQIHPHVNE